MAPGKLMIIQRCQEPIFFFSKKEKTQILRAIQTAERSMSGEIRLHLEKKSPGDVRARAREIFEKIGMTQTKKRNGVLIYLCTQSHQFVVLGDHGIDDKVSPAFWDSMVQTLSEYFKEDRFADGIQQAVLEIGKKLETYFPCESRDMNELPDEISYS